MVRRAICWILVVLIPAWVPAEDARAMLESKGVVLVNGNQTVGLPSVIFSGALIETKDASGASISAPGTSVIVLPGSLVEFQRQRKRCNVQRNWRSSTLYNYRTGVDSVDSI